MSFSVGAARYDLHGLNNRVNEIALAGNRSSRDMHNTDSPGFLAVGLGVLFTEWLSAGGRFVYHGTEYESNIGLGYRTQIVELLGDISLTIPSPSGVELGVRGGMSWGSVTEWQEETISGFLLSITRKQNTWRWSPSTTVLELYAGAKIYISDKAGPFLRVGYSFRDFGDVTASGRAPGSEAVGRPVVNLDFSGWFVELGFGGILRSD
jgi:hypothetical protein